MSTKTNAIAPATKKGNKTATPTANPSNKAKAGKLDKINTAKTVAVVNEETESKYLYPGTAITALDKKAFRRKARQQRAKYEKMITDLKASTANGSKAQLKATEAEMHTWEKETYSHN